MNKSIFCSLLGLAISISLTTKSFAQASNIRSLKLQFVPSNDSFTKDANEYREIWESDGEKIVSAIKKATGLDFLDTAIIVTVYDSMSLSGNRRTGMKMRGRYPYETKKGTLIHELSHRLLLNLSVSRDFEDHPVIFLFLYDVWCDLYGKQFADNQVQIESKRQGYYDYKTAWTNALNISKENRQIQLEEIIEKYKRR